MQRISWWVKSRRAQSDQDYETWLGGGRGSHAKRYGNEADPMFTLTKLDQYGVATPATVRRLTPTECERLQGFPDGWTAQRIDEKKGLIEQADSARYKQMGNAVAVPVVEWIFNRLVEQDKNEL